MQTKTKTLTILFFLILTATIPIATATWTQTTQTGTWTTTDKTNYGQTDYWHDNYEILEWEQNITNFSGYELDLNTLQTQAIARGWGQTGNMHIIVALGFFVNNEPRAVIWNHIDSSQNAIGKQTVTNFGSKQQYSQTYGNILAVSHLGSIHMVLNTTETTTTVEYLNVRNSENMTSIVYWSDQIATNLDGAEYPHYYETFATDLNQENVTIKIFVACKGSGTFNWSELNEQIYYFTE